MSKKHNRPLALFALAQAMGICAMVISAAALLLAVIVPACGSIIAGMAAGEAFQAEPVVVLVLVSGLGVCVMWLLTEFVLMCGRVRKETAFTVQNVRALGHISLAFVIGGCFLLLLGKPLMDWLLLGMRGFRSPVWWLLPSFAAWTAALLVRAIQVLLKRAGEMQTESDLTV